MADRLIQLYDSVRTRDLVEIAVLALAIYLGLQFLGRTRGAGMVRGLGLVVVVLFLVAQVVIASFDLTVLARVLDYLLTTVLFAMLVIFQPELRRGLMMLGRSRVFRYLLPKASRPLAESLTDAAEAMSRECVGALIVIEREMNLDAYVETGKGIDGEASPLLLRAIFGKRSPLHDGAVILRGGRVAAAGCQLPLGPPPENVSGTMGMRHRAALSMSEETDALLLVVSEESGRISIAVAGHLETVPSDELTRRLAELLAADHAAEERPETRGMHAVAQRSAA